jgi:hypothetical protein
VECQGGFGDVKRKCEAFRDLEGSLWVAKPR